MASKLDAFKHLLGKVADERIAEMAGLTVATVVVARKKLGLQEGSAPLEVPEEVILKERREYDEVVQAAARASEEEQPAELEEPTERPAELKKEPEELTPDCVRVVKNRKVMRTPPYDRPREFGFGDVFGSLQPDLRDWLWAHHRDICEPFPR